MLPPRTFADQACVSSKVTDITLNAPEKPNRHGCFTTPTYRKTRFSRSGAGNGAVGTGEAGSAGLDPGRGDRRRLLNIAGIMTLADSRQLLIYGQLALHLRADFDLARMLVAGILETMTRYEDDCFYWQPIRSRRFTGPHAFGSW